MRALQSRLIAVFAAASCLAAQVPTPEISVLYDGAVGWEGVVPVSIPFPRGVHAELECVRVGDDLAPCVSLLRWPDGSVRVARAWPRLSLAPGESVVLGVTPSERSPAAETGRWWFEDAPPLRSLLEDPWGREFVASFEPDPSAGPGGWTLRSSRCRQRRFRSVHRAGGDGYLGLRAYLTTYRGDRHATLTVLLDNDAADGVALGPVRLRAWALQSTNASLRFRPRWREQNLLPEPAATDAGYRQTLLRRSDQLYLGDRTAKAIRFDLFFDGVDVSDTSRRRAMVDRPVALPTLGWTRHTGAFGAHGGPAPGDERPDVVATGLESAWSSSAWFGPFGDFGDPADSAAQGTRRNGPCALHNVVRCQSPALLRIAEAQVLQHPLRPTPGFRPRLPRATSELRQGMSRRTIDRPHGFTALDYEHFSVDLLYDYFWLTADPLARDEIVRMGLGLPAVLAGVPFRTPRGEGWCLQAAVSIARATGDPALRDFAYDHFVKTLMPRLGSDSQPWVLQQPPHDLAFGVTGHPFEVPWQVAAMIHGMRALWDEVGDLRIAHTVVRSARIMATVGWAEGEGPKYLYSTVDPRRYRMPVGFGPIEGTARMQIGAFELAIDLLEVTDSEPDRSLLTSRADFLNAGDGALAEVARDPWFQIHLDRHR